MAQPGSPRRRTLAIVIGLAVAVGAIAASVWVRSAVGPRDGASSRVATSPGFRRPPDVPTRATASGPGRGPLTVVALGDSVPAATTCDCDGYPALVGRSLRTATGRAVKVHNDATDGWTTADVEHDLTSGSTSRDLSQADLVLVEVGANDFDLDRVDDASCRPAATSACWADAMAGLRIRLVDIVAGIRHEASSSSVRIALIGYWNVTLDGDVGAQEGPTFVTGSDTLTRAVNAVVLSAATSSHTTYVDAYGPFKADASVDLTSSLLDDGDHLSSKGHAIMADAIIGTLRADGTITALKGARDSSGR